MQSLSPEAIVVLKLQLDKKKHLEKKEKMKTKEKTTEQEENIYAISISGINNHSLLA